MRITDLLVPVQDRDSPSESEVFSVSERLGIVPQRNLFTKKIALDDRSRYLRISWGDVVYNPYLLWNRAVGVCFDRQGGCVSPAYVVLRPITKGTEKFLHYFLRSKIFTSVVDSIASGSVTRRRTAPVNDILQLDFDLAPVPCQIAASALLTAIDDKIELNRRMNETLEAMARTVFKSWFVDFDPVVAKSEGRHPDGMDAATAKLFSCSFVDSEIGRIPKGWTAGIFGDVGCCRRDITDVKDFPPETAYIGLEHMPRRSIALSEWGDASFVESAKSRFSKGNVLFGKLRPYFHKVGIAPVDGVCSTDILVIVPRKAEWSAFVLGYASSDEMVDFSDGCSTGTRMPRVSWGDLARYPLPLPPPELASKLTTIFAPILETIIANIQERRLLTSMRESILPKLLSGDLRV